MRRPWQVHASRSSRIVDTVAATSDRSSASGPAVSGSTAKTAIVVPMLSWDPTDDDIEGMVIDALEALPAPFRDELGSVAIVIEEEASPAQLAVGRGTRAVRALPGRAADALGRRRRPDPEQDHDLPRPARSGPTGPRNGSRRLSTDTVYHEIAHHFGISDARLHELQGERRGD